MRKRTRTQPTHNKHTFIIHYSHSSVYQHTAYTQQVDSRVYQHTPAESQVLQQVHKQTAALWQYWFKTAHQSMNSHRAAAEQRFWRGKMSGSLPLIFDSLPKASPKGNFKTSESIIFQNSFSDRGFLVWKSVSEKASIKNKIPKAKFISQTHGPSSHQLTTSTLVTNQPKVAHLRTANQTRNGLLNTSKIQALQSKSIALKWPKHR